MGSRQEGASQVDALKLEAQHIAALIETDLFDRGLGSGFEAAKILRRAAARIRLVRETPYLQGKWRNSYGSSLGLFRIRFASQKAALEGLDDTRINELRAIGHNYEERAAKAYHNAQLAGQKNKMIGARGELSIDFILVAKVNPGSGTCSQIAQPGVRPSHSDGCFILTILPKT